VPAPPNASETFTDVIAQLDRGLDERQKLINALKGQLSKVSAMPKTAPPAPMPMPAFPTQLPPQRPRTAVTPPPMQADPLEVTAGPLMLPPGYQGANQSWATPPVAKRARFDDLEAGPSAAEAAELAAMKAKMLGNLQAAESIAQAKAPAMALPVGEEEATLTSTSEAMSMPAGASDASPAPPQASDCPPGISQEEFEAYRQKCWKEYYEKCAVWQKYYTQYQAEKGKSKGKSMMIVPKMAPPMINPGKGGKGNSLPPIVPAKSAVQVVRPNQGMLVNPAMAGKGRMPMAIQGARQRAEEDIHSKLLGL